MSTINHLSMIVVKLKILIKYSFLATANKNALKCLMSEFSGVQRPFREFNHYNR